MATLVGVLIELTLDLVNKLVIGFPGGLIHGFLDAIVLSHNSTNDITKGTHNTVHDYNSGTMYHSAVL